MGFSTKQFITFLFWFIMIYIIAFISDFYITPKFNVVIGFATKMISYALIFVYISLTFDNRGNKNEW